MRRKVLEAVGAWDSYNVTEDADLGVRLHRQGWRTAVLDSTTYEEPNNDFVNWMKQRSRWYKGYVQTWLVNLRHPVELWRDLGPAGFAQFNLFVGGTPLLALLNPVFWFLTLVWFVGKAGIIQEIFPRRSTRRPLLLDRRQRRHPLHHDPRRPALEPKLTGLAACLVPVLRVMMSMTAIKAFWQVIAAPSFWEKTTTASFADDAALPPVVPLTPDTDGNGTRRRRPARRRGNGLGRSGR